MPGDASGHGVPVSSSPLTRGALSQDQGGQQVCAPETPPQATSEGRCPQFGRAEKLVRERRACAAAMVTRRSEGQPLPQGGTPNRTLGCWDPLGPTGSESSDSPFSPSTQRQQQAGVARAGGDTLGKPPFECLLRWDGN